MNWTGHSGQLRRARQLGRARRVSWVSCVWRNRGERGSAVGIDTVLIVPVIMIILMLITAGFRIAMAGDAVQNVAAAASRAATLARTAGEARRDAKQVASSNLTTSGLTCQASSVAIDTSGFAVPVGKPAAVAVTVSCTVPLADLLVPGLQGSRILSATARSPLDTFRERQG